MSLFKKIFIVLGIAVILGGIYYFVNKPTEAPAPASGVDTIVDPTGPDLVISDVREGQGNADYIVTIQNTGQKPVTNYFYVCEWEFDRSPSANTCNNGKIANYDEGKMAASILKPNEKLEIVFTINHLTVGQKLYFEVDKSNGPPSDNSILESNEKNNSYVFIKK
jgi:hypothetical protein